MAAIDLKSQLQSMVKLQEVDSEIYALRQEKAEAPAQVKALEAAFEAKKQQAAELEKAMLEAQKQRREKELELAGKEEQAKKLQGQLYALKTNKEYQVMLQQIQDTKADASLIEDKILELFDKTDKVKAEAEREKERLKVEESAFLAEKGKVEERIKAIDGRLAQLDNQRQQIIPQVDPKMLKQYERILANRDGLAIALVRDDSCSGCNMLVPPQVINLIKMYERLVTCEVCNRILYVQG